MLVDIAAAGHNESEVARRSIMYSKRGSLTTRMNRKWISSNRKMIAKTGITKKRWMVGSRSGW